MQQNLSKSESMCKLDIVTPLAKELNCLDIEKISRVCIDKITELIGAKLASLYILEDGSDILHLEKHNHSFLINHIVSLNQNPASPMIAAVRTKELMVIQNIDAQNKPFLSNTTREYSENYKSKSCIIAPLICHSRVVGVLNLSDKTDGGNFSEEDIAITELFRQLIGASIGNVKLFEKAQKLAKTDGLTGLANHRTFYDTLERELRRSNRYGGLISVIMIDMDKLKPINDNHGHRAGDMAIKQVARLIKNCIRQIDVAARYGGDEYSVILPNTSLEEARVVAQRILDTVNNTPLMWEGKEINLSVSVGFGVYDSTFSPEDVTRCSDFALYEAKKRGNTVEIFDSLCNIQIK